MRVAKEILRLISVFLALHSHVVHAVSSNELDSQSCSSLFLSVQPKKHSSKITQEELTGHVAKNIDRVLEFAFIRNLAQKMGIRVWLFGGTASSFLHYVKWDLTSLKGIQSLQRERFDYDFTNIFRSTQDIDIVVDATAEVAKAFQNKISERFPHFLGDKSNSWEVRTLRYRIGQPGKVGYKEALLDDPDFHDQNTDSNSVGMIELTHPPRGEAMVRDLKNWNQAQSVFLEDTLKDQIHFFRSDRHFLTSRAKAGENPEILSVLRILVKAFQYNLNISEQDLKQILMIAQAFNPSDVKNLTARRRIQDTAKKLVFHAVNLEYAMSRLESLDLRRKLISMGNRGQKESVSWWLNREPLRSKPVGDAPYGKTAAELGIDIVSHETNHFQASESIVRAHSGEPNVLISRQSAPGEAASYGDGFYTVIGSRSVRGTGLTIKFRVDPRARQGYDFNVYNGYVIFKNKKALTVIPESLNISFDDLIQIAEKNQEIELDLSQGRLLEIQKRRLNSAKLIDETEPLLRSGNLEDLDRLNRLLIAIHSPLNSLLISKDVREAVVKNIFSKVVRTAQSSREDKKFKYVQIVGRMIPTLDSMGLYKISQFEDDLMRIVQSKRASFELRKEALFEFLLSGNQFENKLHLTELFSQAEYQSLIKEIWNWYSSSDLRKAKFLYLLNQRWSESIEREEISKNIVPLIESGIFQVNQKNVSGLSILQLATYYQQKTILNWLIENSDFDFNAKNELGLTEVEQLQLRDKKEWVDEIRRRRPEVEARTFELKGRDFEQTNQEYPQGMPIIDFVRIEPGTFLMGSVKKVFVTITQPFEFMSVDTTQKMYRTVLDLLRNKLGGEYQEIRPDPSNTHFIGDHFPVNGVYYNEATLWIEGLNELSRMNDPEVQKSLEEIFPGHHLGSRYRLPTEAQWEMVSRLGGYAERDYSFGKNSLFLSDYVVYDDHANVKLLPVGSKKPVFYLGKPIYDIHGLIWRWIIDWYGKRIIGGVDPEGPPAGTYRVLRGGSFITGFAGVTSSNRFYSHAMSVNPYAGFRLVRTEVE